MPNLFCKRSGHIRHVLVIAILATLIMLACTRWGAGISPDSTIYVGAARNLLEGHGLTHPRGDVPLAPLAHWPPFLSLVLAVPGLIGVDPLETARALQVFLFAVNAILVGGLVRAYSSSTRLGALAGALFITWEVPLEIHSWAWSEPLFICLALIGFALLSAYLAGGRSRFLVGSGLCIGLALLTRYIGVTLIVTAFVAIMAARERRRISSLAIFGLLSLLPMVVWQIVLHQAGTSSRSIGFHIPRIPLNDAFQLLLPAILATAFYALSLRRPAGGSIPSWVKRVPSILVLFIVVYVLLFPLPLIFLDVSTPIDTRLLFPAYVPLLIVAISGMAGLRPWIRKHRRREMAAFAIAGLLLVINLLEAAPLILKKFEDGGGYASRRWRESELMTHIVALDPDVRIFSNAPDAIFLLANRPALSIPATIDLASGQAQDDVHQNLGFLVARMDAENSILAWFDGVDRYFLPSRDMLAGHLDREPSHEFSDGCTYRGRSPGERD